MASGWRCPRSLVWNVATHRANHLAVVSNAMPTQPGWGEILRKRWPQRNFGNRRRNDDVICLWSEREKCERSQARKDIRGLFAILRRSCVIRIRLWNCLKDHHQAVSCYRVLLNRRVFSEILIERESWCCEYIDAESFVFSIGIRLTDMPPSCMWYLKFFYLGSYV